MPPVINLIIFLCPFVSCPLYFRYCPLLHCLPVLLSFNVRMRVVIVGLPLATVRPYAHYATFQRNGLHSSLEERCNQRQRQRQNRNRNSRQRGVKGVMLSVANRTACVTRNKRASCACVCVPSELLIIGAIRSAAGASLT